MTKTCSRCKEAKPTIDFGKRAALKDGLRSRCRECENSAMRGYREARPEAHREYRQKWCQANPEKKAAANRSWNERNVGRRIELNKGYAERYPEKARAQHAVTRDVARGKIHKPELCSRCGALPDVVDLHAHHDDYSEPFDIEWVCRTCHVEHHQKEGTAA